MKERLLLEIPKILTATSLTEPFYNMVLSRLEGLGYTLQADDAWGICFNIKETENHIKSTCNVNKIPEDLYQVAVDMICGGFLLAKKQTGKLDETYNFETAVKSMRTGDTDIAFAIGDGTKTPEQRFDILINYLLNSREDDLLCFRKIKW